MTAGEEVMSAVHGMQTGGPRPSSAAWLVVGPVVVPANIVFLLPPFTKKIHIFERAIISLKSGKVLFCD